MNDIKIVNKLKEQYDKGIFNTTASILKIVPNALYFIKSEKYLKYLKDISNIHIITSIKNTHITKYKNVQFYIVDDIKYVFGEVHNYIHNNMSFFYTKPEIHPTSFVHKLASLDEEGIRLYHTPDGYKKQLKHISNVIIKSHTNIGSNTVIHRGLFQPTIIGNYVTIGSLVNIGHNCFVDDHTVITPGTVLCGGAKIGKNCWIGVNSSFRQRVKICDNVVIGQHSNVRQNITESGIYAGEPLRKIREFTENWNFGL